MTVDGIGERATGSGRNPSDGTRWGRTGPRGTTAHRTRPGGIGAGQRRPGWSRLGLAGLVGAMLLTVVAAVPAAAAVDVRAHGESRVLGDIRHQRLEIQLGGGAVARGNVLWFREDDPAVDLRPRLARGTIAGLEQMVPLSRAGLPHGAVAGINGGYSLPRPSGAPNGLHVTDGRLVAGQAVNNFGGGGRPIGRGMVGIQPEGRLVMDELIVGLRLDQPDAEQPLEQPAPEPPAEELDPEEPVEELDPEQPVEQPDAEPVWISEINRQMWPPTALLNNRELGRPEGELLLYDDLYGASILVPGGSTLAVVDGLQVGTSGRTEGQVLDVRRVIYDTTFATPLGTYVLLAYGERAADLALLDVGHRVGVTTLLTPKRTPADGWLELSGGVAGGQLMVQDGARRPSSEWTTYSAFSQSHATGRQPRTAIGRTADGQGMLVTVDGRQSGWSTGLSVGELADTMLALGAVDAVNLDGGGSTTMTVGARIRNRPSEPNRSIADGLFLHTTPPPPSRTVEQACPDGAVPATDFLDVPGTTHASAIACLAWWDVTQGVTATTFVPDAGVTRAQMASFIVNWIDGMAERGSGRDLPETDVRPFDDVGDGNVHATSIARLSAAGIISGRTPSTYEPQTVMSRAQTASLLRAALGYVTETDVPAGRDTFIDDNGSVHEGNIDALSGIGVIAGTGGFDVRPGDPVTRGAMASLIMRSGDVVVEAGRTLPPG